MATGDHLTELLAAAEEEFAEAGFRTGDFARVRELLAEALAGAEQAGDLAGRARALDLLGMVAHYGNITMLMSGHRVLAEEIDAEERLFRQALAAWHAAGQRPATAQAHCSGSGWSTRCCTMTGPAPCRTSGRHWSWLR